MSDGSYQAVVYSYPVHELVDGVWVEMESTNQNARGEVAPDSARSNIIDNFVWENHGVQNNNAIGLDIGLRSGYRCRAYIRFATMPTIPAGSTITAATMTVNIVSGTSTANNAMAYQVGGPWESATIQWSNMPAANTLLASNISHNNKTKYQFSCLTAVRHWYNGSTTGQNQNYGIMLRYADETINDYNSFYSADYSNATKRPSLTISYTPPSSSLTVDKGSSRQLSVSGTSGTVSWVSADPTVASVNASGVVTGIRLGQTTVTVYDGDSAYKTFAIRVTLVDGVYRLQNSGLFLGTYGSIAENTYARLLASASAGLDYIRQLWKITYLGDGYYSIRPMHKLDMVLHADDTPGSAVDIATVGSDNTLGAVPLAGRWKISTTSDGTMYCLEHNGTSGSLRAENGTVSPGLGVTTGTYSDYLSVFRWSLLPIDDLNNRLLLYDARTDAIMPSIARKTIANGAYSMADLMIETSIVSIDADDLSVAWVSLNPQIATVNASTGEVIGHVPGGSATIRGTIEGDKTDCTVEYRVSVYNDSSQNVFYAIPDSGHDHLSQLEEAKNQLASAYFTHTTIISTPVSALACKTDLKSARVFTSRSHGIRVPLDRDPVTSTLIVLLDAPNITNASLFLSHAIEGMGPDWVAIEDSDDFSNLDLALFVGCYTAAGGAGGNNLPTRIVGNGCKVSIGFTESIGCGAANTWVDVFYEEFVAGASVAEAANSATDAVKFSTSGISEDTVVIVGDSSLTLEDLIH